MDSSQTVTTTEEMDYKKAIQDIFQEIDRLDVSIRRHQAETDRLNAETREKLDKLKAMF